MNAHRLVTRMLSAVTVRSLGLRLVVLLSVGWSVGIAAGQSASGTTPSIFDLAVGEWSEHHARLVLQKDGRFVTYLHKPGERPVQSGSGTFQFSEGPLHLQLVHTDGTGRSSRIPVLRLSATELQMKGDGGVVRFRRSNAGQAAFAARWGAMYVNENAQLGVPVSPATASGPGSTLPVPSVMDLLVADYWNTDKLGRLAFQQNGEYVWNFPREAARRGTFRLLDSRRLEMTRDGGSPTVSIILKISTGWLRFQSDRADGQIGNYYRVIVQTDKLESRWADVAYEDGQPVRLIQPAPDPAVRKAWEEIGRDAAEGFRKGLIRPRGPE